MRWKLRKKSKSPKRRRSSALESECRYCELICYNYNTLKLIGYYNTNKMEEFSQAELAAIRRWITCIAVVKFDIDEGTHSINTGQMVEYILPKGALSKAE
jgi:hypothetical protein